MIVEFEPDSPSNEELNEMVEKILSGQEGLFLDLYKNLTAAIKKKSNPRIKDYRQATENHFQQLNFYIEASYGKKIELKDFLQNNEIECLANYFTKYLCLMVVYCAIETSVIEDFYKPKKKKKYSDPRVYSYVNGDLQTMQQVLKIQEKALSKTQKFKNLESNLKRKPTNLLQDNEYPERPPQEFFNQEDGKILERLLKKLVHTDCFLYAKLYEKETGTKYEKWSAGRNKEAFKILKAYASELCKFFQFLGLSQIENAGFVEKCLELISAPFIKKYADTSLADTFVYKKTTIKQKMKKEFKFDVGNMSLEELTPQIGNLYQER